MPVKKSSIKKTTKKAAKKKIVNKKPAIKKPGLFCTICGMEVTIEKSCGCTESHSLICCGQPMALK